MIPHTKEEDLAIFFKSEKTFTVSDSGGHDFTVVRPSVVEPHSNYYLFITFKFCMYQLTFALALVSHCCDRTYQKYEVLKISYCSDNIVLNNATVKMELKLVSWESVLKVKDETNISSYCIA